MKPLVGQASLRSCPMGGSNEGYVPDSSSWASQFARARTHQGAVQAHAGRAAVREDGQADVGAIA